MLSCHHDRIPQDDVVIEDVLASDAASDHAGQLFVAFGDLAGHSAWLAIVVTVHRQMVLVTAVARGPGHLFLDVHSRVFSFRHMLSLCLVLVKRMVQWRPWCLRRVRAPVLRASECLHFSPKFIYLFFGWQFG